ncbi:NAD-dependent epimerase/dehydratase family protein [Paenibacillus sp. MBLB4367]|uniref:NAD-dependent epimerase/dehydratase family protein n=1 Tax=Paenibacillus sp. MBLB4367 TaxID=3384767 RepID=UPI00390824A0
MKATKAIVTGATGYVGSRLAARLASEGWDVHAVARPDSNPRLLEKLTGNLTIHRYDGTIDRLFAIFQEAKPEIVFHLASVFMAEHRPGDIEPMLRANVLFGTQLAEAMARYGVSRLINTGTSWQHYENSDFNPVCLYAATKQAMDSILTYYVEAASIKVITLKLFDTYGPGDPRKKLFSLLQEAASGRGALEMSGGEQLIDLVYIDDVVQAYRLAAARLLGGLTKGGETYALSSGKPIPLKKLVELVAQSMGRKLPIEWGARPYRKREVMIPWSKGEPLPGWQPTITLEEGLLKMGFGSKP